MGTVWAQRREEVFAIVFVSPDVFHQMVERLAEFVVPYQHVLETEAGQRNVYLYLGFPEQACKKQRSVL